MIAVVFTEFTEWFKSDSRITLAALLVILGLIGSLSLLRPELCLEVLTAYLIWIANKVGKHSWSEFTTAEWALRTKLPILKIICGKILVAIVLNMIHLFMVFPLLIIMIQLWGFSWLQLGSVLLIAIIATIIAAGLGLTGFYFGKDEENLVTNLPVIGWLILTALIPIARVLNPFFLVWNTLSPESQPLLIAYPVNIGLAGLVVWATGFVYRGRNANV